MTYMDKTCNTFLFRLSADGIPYLCNFLDKKNDDSASHKTVLPSYSIGEKQG